MAQVLMHLTAHTKISDSYDAIYPKDASSLSRVVPDWESEEGGDRCYEISSWTLGEPVGSDVDQTILILYRIRFGVPALDSQWVDEGGHGLVLTRFLGRFAL